MSKDDLVARLSSAINPLATHTLIETTPASKTTAVRMHSLSLLALMAAATSTLALTIPSLSPRQSSRITCGNTYYTAASLDDAVQAGCNYLQSGRTIGSDKYPHVYNDYEGFSFDIEGPFYEFPVEKGYAYTGGKFCCWDFLYANGERDEC